MVPNGIDLARFRFDPLQLCGHRTRQRLGLPEGAYVIGGIGRLTAGKRFDVLVRALARLPGYDWLLLVGGGPEENVLRRTAHEAGVADLVLFAGECPCVPDGSPGHDLPSLVLAMDVLASPSPEESFGLAIVEALASGLPVRYASCPATRPCPRTAPRRPAASPAARTPSRGPSPRPARPVRYRAPPPRPPTTTASRAAPPG
ncbi:Glycosyl transferase OS=Streptomyces glaucescens OX=1907 GN=SGLAU_12340 PE=4 SV=1 [Streptomyces glaucescens]